MTVNQGYLLIIPGLHSYLYFSTMESINDLAVELEVLWRKEAYKNSVFPRLCQQVLQKYTLHQQFHSAQVMKTLLATTPRYSHPMFREDYKLA